MGIDMHVRATVIASWALGLLVAQSTVGCAVELVRPSVDPPAVTARPIATPIAGSVVCELAGGYESDEQVLQELMSAIRGSGVFRGDVLASGPAGSEAPCEARLSFTRESEPVIQTDAREAVVFFSCFPPYVLFPLALIWTDREPDLVDRYVLEVAVRGEPAVRYAATARGTICAQTPNAGQAAVGLTEARTTLRAEALRALVSRFADDREAHARLRAQLDDGPALELEPLLVNEETYAERARWRTRKLIGWKNESLAAHVAEAKTSELRALAGRLETCMVDLSHEAEVEKDAAQTFTAAGADADAQGKREMSLAYRERVEVLRPILTAVKEELDGRDR